LSEFFSFWREQRRPTRAGSGGELIFRDVLGHRNLQKLARNYKDSAGELVLWDAVGRKHHQQRRWQQLPGAVLSLAFAPDGRHLITANSNGTAYVLRLGGQGVVSDKGLSAASNRSPKFFPQAPLPSGNWLRGKESP
jgi:hypothetical protein